MIDRAQTTGDEAPITLEEAIAATRNIPVDNHKVERNGIYLTHQDLRFILQRRELDGGSATASYSLEILTAKDGLTDLFYSGWVKREEGAPHEPHEKLSSLYLEIAEKISGYEKDCSIRIAREARSTLNKILGRTR